MRSLAVSCLLACVLLLPSAASAAGLPSGRTSYRSYDDYVRAIDALVAAHPSLARRVVLPHRTLGGRAMPAVEIARDVRRDDGRPAYLVVGLTHAREWSSGENAIEYAIDLVRHAATPRIAALLASERTIVVPVANPDGFAATMNGEPDRRTNCRDVGVGPAGPGCGAGGVDLNRNYGAFWGGTGASPVAGGDTYRGSGPWSEPETQSIHELSQSLPITAVVSLHSIAGLVLRPPGFRALGTAPDEARMRALGDAMGAATGYRSELDYAELGDITGALEDWNYAAQGAFGYTIELGPRGASVFEGPFSSYVTEQYLGTGARGGVREALLLAGEAAADRGDHAVLSGRAPAGSVLALRKSFSTPTSPVCGDDACLTPGPALSLPDSLSLTLRVGSSGRFAWDVGPSTRPWVLKAGGRETWTLSCGDVTHAVLVARGQTARVDPCVAGSPVRVGRTSSFALSVGRVGRAALLSRGVLARATCARSCTVRVTLSVGGRRVGSASSLVAGGAAGPSLVRARVTRAGAARVRSGRVLVARVTAREAGGRSSTVKRSWHL